ncbi:MAG: hypothetical protein HFE90_04955 [Firmicutes bacterium]|nr:hypothetical protein [Bacillota bacterium]
MSQGFVLSNKQERMVKNAADMIVSDRTYNLVIGAVVVYGVFVNMLMCKFLAPVILGINWLVLIIGYIACVLAGTMIAYKSDSPVISFLGYNLVVIPIGAVLTVCLQAYSPGVIYQAFLLTGIITFIMLAAATIMPGTFAGMGRMLFIALIGLIVANLVCLIFHIQTIITAWIAAVIFSLYIGYDWVKAQMYVKTLDNAVDSALDIYLDIINLFIQLLSILGRRTEE